MPTGSHILETAIEKGKRGLKYTLPALARIRRQLADIEIKYDTPGIPPLFRVPGRSRKQD